MESLGWRQRRGSSPAARRGARQRTGLTPVSASNTLSCERETHQTSSGRSNFLDADHGIYRALTDERGMAKLKVAKGRYKLFVSGFQYIAYQGIIDVTGDVTARAELTSEPEGQEDYR